MTEEATALAVRVARQQTLEDKYWKTSWSVCRKWSHAFKMRLVFTIRKRVTWFSVLVAYGITQSHTKKEQQAIVQQVITQELGGKTYSAGQARSYVNAVNRRAVEALKAVSQNFKWIVSTIVVQRDDAGKQAGLQSASAHLVDPATDGSVSVAWESRTMQCMVTIHVVAI